MSAKTGQSRRAVAPDVTSACYFHLAASSLCAFSETTDHPESGQPAVLRDVRADCCRGPHGRAVLSHRGGSLRDHLSHLVGVGHWQHMAVVDFHDR